MIKKELELFDEFYDEYNADKGGALYPNQTKSKIKAYIISSHIRLMEEMASELASKKKYLYQEMAKGVMCAVKGAPGYNECIDDQISHLQDTITNLKKELR